MDPEQSSRVPVGVRSVVLVVALLSLAGCISALGGQDGGPECQLNHEIVDSGSYGDVTETFAYENLSDEAQHAFDEARADGSYVIEDQSQAPPEFRYGDEAAAYNVTKGNETYTLLTYSGEGCEGG